MNSFLITKYIIHKLKLTPSKLVLRKEYDNQREKAQTMGPIHQNAKGLMELKQLEDWNS
jgi:hypothetical protein